MPVEKIFPSGVDLKRRSFVKSTAYVAGSAALLSSPASIIAQSSPDPIVKTRLGKLSGEKHDGVYSFKGVRYGEDTSTRRFQPALAAEKWNGILRANEYPNAAPQTGASESISEDCLFLNIWTPAIHDNKKRPVLFYLHGGAYSNGSGSHPLYDGTNLSLRGDVVVITVNHRLNAFGYLYLAGFGAPEFAYSGNVGQLDLVMALQWVRDHIEHFGGDPGNITVFGQSGGGAKIATLMATPAAKNLFHKAWTMSGQQVTVAGPRAATQRAEYFLEALNVTSQDVTKLKDLPIEDLLAATQIKDLSKIEDKTLHFCPVLDQLVLPRHPFYPDAAPQSAHIPMVIGNTREETRAFLGNIPGVFSLTWEQLPDLITQHQFVDIKADMVIAEYRRMYPKYSPTEVFFAATTTGRSWRGAIIEAEERARQKGAATYVYQLDWGSPLDGGKFGAGHTLDIALVFDNTAVPVSRTGNGKDARKMAEQMSESLIAFARTGNPNHKRIPKWKPYTLKSRETMVFDNPSSLQNDPRGGERKLYARVPFMQRGTY
ncbi:MAG: carboxylesterase/lipase family protein [Gammaproteobacteria bacterium]|nr:carboxylesterase/lipase family protein [Gammaproteobacteria bacterium]